MTSTAEREREKAANRAPGPVADLVRATEIVRILGENFRMPDAIIANEEFAHWGVTRGQLLSFVMLSVGVVYLMYFATRKVPKLGGWMTKQKA